MRMTGPLALAFLVAAATAAGAQAQFDAEAVRLNNRGAAQMGQQLTERAAGSFAQAFQKDPKLAQAAINEGIALLYLQKLDEAKRLFGPLSLWTRTMHRPGTTWGWCSTRAMSWSRRSRAFNMR